MKNKECPSCAMQVDAASKTCPICNYEFAETGNGLKWAVILLALFLLFYFLFF